MRIKIEYPEQSDEGRYLLRLGTSGVMNEFKGRFAFTSYDGGFHSLQFLEPNRPVLETFMNTLITLEQHFQTPGSAKFIEDLRQKLPQN